MPEKIVVARHWHVAKSLQLKKCIISFCDVHIAALLVFVLTNSERRNKFVLPRTCATHCNSEKGYFTLSGMRHCAY
jgi:hypothetical protein